MVDKVKCLVNHRGFTKGRIYNLVEPVDEADSFAEVYNDDAEEIEIDVFSEVFEVVE